MSGEGSEMPRWERELRALSGAFCDESELRRRANSIRVLIEQDLLRPVEDEPAECPSGERGSPSIALDLRPPEDWTPFDGAKPAFTEEDADMLLARMDDAEAEIKALQEEAQNARIRDQRTHGRIDGVVRRIAQGLASASDTAMKEVGK